jgi:hypothetical protein
MTTALSIGFLASLAGMCGLGLYGCYHAVREMVEERAWGFIAFFACLLIFLTSAIALSMSGDLPAPPQPSPTKLEHSEERSA